MKSIVRRDRIKKRSFIAEPIAHHGICSGCVNLPICSYAKHSGQPIMFCEEFEDSDRKETVVNKTKGSDAGNGVNYSDNSVGLCMTCQNHNHCTFSAQAGGVWQCEEYR